MRKKDYEIGFGKPPEISRFKKGKSGNPKGRPKGSKDFGSDLRDVLNAKVTVSENGKSRKVSSQRATLMRLREQALKGNARAIDRMLDLAKAQSFEEGSRETERQLSATEDGILERYADCLIGQTQNGEQDRENSEVEQDDDGRS
ncbi:hypothetical protein ALP8811_00985 [Aliiroseovarius pelagivivens]|uniref:DUF5681 domain-containing protein n=1 Tax=Aliiroseovarius pelagivivens TaxID=1639690 RepID=A0A2R8AJB4_9RHOB|nr:DUF5681 domain-containing protein [Aliiroseovarius pelagivivens]SPF75989.1 hypothetical protein ALP8811_00985 [Aliiroseovarius pelagivivens]